MGYVDFSRALGITSPPLLSFFQKRKCPKKNLKSSSESYKNMGFKGFLLMLTFGVIMIPLIVSECYLKIEAFEMKLGAMSFACSEACPCKIRSDLQKSSSFLRLLPSHMLISLCILCSHQSGNILSFQPVTSRKRLVH